MDKRSPCPPGRCAGELPFHSRRRRPANRSIPHLNGRELTILVPLVVLVLWIGVYPRPFLDRT